jgi:uncharacterized membrane protein (DUF485 family)
MRKGFINMWTFMALLFAALVFGLLIAFHKPFLESLKFGASVGIVLIKSSESDAK